MTAKQKKLFLLTSMMSVFVMAVTVLFTGGKLSMSPFSVRGGTEEVNGSITWTWSNSERIKHANNRYSFLRRTQRGTGIYLYSYGQGNQGSGKIWSSKYNTTYSYGLFVSATEGSSSLFEFQSITSISIVTASSSDSGATFAIYGGGTDTTPLITKTILTPGQTISYTPSSETKYLSINATNGYWVDIESITVNYSCSTGGSPSAKSLSSISLSGQTTEFAIGDEFVFGGTVTATYSDFTTDDVTALVTFSGYDMSEPGNQTVTVSYTESGVTETTSYSITVSSSESSVVTLSGIYNFSGRNLTSSDVGYKDWRGHMSIEFDSNGTCAWVNDRPGNVTSYKARVNFNYTATNDGAKINLSLLQTSYYFERKGTYDADYSEYDYASAWMSDGYDRPVDRSFTASNPQNNTGVMLLSKNSFTISVYRYANSSYSVFDQFTFTKA